MNDLKDTVEKAEIVRRPTKRRPHGLERQRLVVEASGAIFVVAAMALIHPALGVLFLGLGLILAANFYMGDEGDDDAGSG